MNLLYVSDGKISSNIPDFLKNFMPEWVIDNIKLDMDDLEHEYFDYDVVFLHFQTKDIKTEWVSRLRQVAKNGLVICLPAPCSSHIRTLCWQMGADDVIDQSNHHMEIKARMEALCRHIHGQNNNVFISGDLHVDLHAKTVKSGNAFVKLTSREFSLLKLLILNSGRVISKETILSRLYHADEEPLSRTIDVFLCGLRKKIGNQYFETVWGEGYRFQTA